MRLPPVRVLPLRRSLTDSSPEPTRTVSGRGCSRSPGSSSAQEDHLAMLAAARERDAERAVAVLLGHLDTAAVTIDAFFRERAG